MRTFLFALALFSLSAVSGSQNYVNGPAGKDWDDSAELAFGPCQSGIGDATDSGAPNSSEPLRLFYSPVPLNVVDSGDTITAKYGTGSKLLVGAKAYELKQFHFHPVPRKNIGGGQPQLVVDLVHADAEGHFAIVSVVMKSGEANSAVDTVWRNEPAVRNRLDAVAGVDIDASELLPEKLDYFAFRGSVGTPLCSQEVVWYVLKEPVQISPSQVEQFERRHSGKLISEHSSHGRKLELPK